MIQSVSSAAPALRRIRARQHNQRPTTTPRSASTSSTQTLGDERPFGAERVLEPARRQPQVPGPSRPDEQRRPAHPARLALPGADPTTDRRDGPDLGGGEPHRRHHHRERRVRRCPSLASSPASPSPRAGRHSMSASNSVSLGNISSVDLTPTIQLGHARPRRPALRMTLQNRLDKNRTTRPERDNRMPVISLAAADSGISTMQTEIDTIGNNVANADSDGYQEADVQFSDILTQQLRPGAGPRRPRQHRPGLGRRRRPGRRHADELQPGRHRPDRRADRRRHPGERLLRGRPGRQHVLHPCRELPAGCERHSRRRQTAPSCRAGPGRPPTTGPTGPITIPSSMTLAPQETANVTMGGNIPSGGTAFTTTATHVRRPGQRRAA